MWISKKAYDAMHDEWLKNHEEARVLAEQNRALQVTQDWFRVRVTQLEKERAILLNNFMGLKIEVPNYDVTPPSGAKDPLAILGGTQIFEDMGDDEAKRHGIEHTADGRVAYK